MLSLRSFDVSQLVRSGTFTFYILLAVVGRAQQIEQPASPASKPGEIEKPVVMVSVWRTRTGGEIRRYAFRLSEAELKDATEEHRRGGRRIVSLSANVKSDSDRTPVYHAVWEAAHAKETEYYVGLSIADLRTAFAARTGGIPISLHPYGTGENTRFVLVRELDGPRWAGELDLTRDSLDAHVKALKSSGMQPSVVVSYDDQVGEKRFAVVGERSSREVHCAFDMSWGEVGAFAEKLPKEAELVWFDLYLRGYILDDTEASCSVLWRAGDPSQHDEFDIQYTYLYRFNEYKRDLVKRMDKDGAQIHLLRSFFRHSPSPGHPAKP